MPEETNRRSLFHRTKVMAYDVALALTQLVEADAGSGLPIAINKQQVAEKLVEIANTDDEGNTVRLSSSARKFSYDNFLNILLSSVIFQAGYQKYEHDSKNPCAPVTDYFFNHVYQNGSHFAHVRDALGAMEPIEITHSMPKRPTEIENEDGEFMISGKVAGVVIFPPNSKEPLLIAWLKRRAAHALGTLGKTVDRIERSHPDAVTAIENMREAEGALPGTMRKAIASPRKK